MTLRQLRTHARARFGPQWGQELPGWNSSKCAQKLVRECNSVGGQGAATCENCAKIVRLQSGSNCSHEDVEKFARRYCTPQDDLYWTINDVIPPDESAGLRNGSAYTNAIGTMVKTYGSRFTLILAY